MIKIIIFTHGELGQAILKTAENIVGKQEDAFVFTLEAGDSLSSVCRKFGEMLERLTNQEGILILTDMKGGTPCNASLSFSKDEKIEIVTGINLYMLISAFMNRAKLPINELAEKVIEDAKKNITNAKEKFLNKFKE